MLVLPIFMFLIVFGLHRWASRTPPSSADVRGHPPTRPWVSARPADLVSFPDRVQDRWTSLDDRQLTRLLEDNAPC